MKNIQIRIIQTSDLHGYIYPLNYATNKYENIGISKVSSFISKHRNKNTILIDSGDTIQGSPLTYFFAKEGTGPNPMSSIMNYLNYDYVTMGNHEFNYGLDYLDNYLSNLTAKILNSNILKDEKPFYGIPYDIKVIEDIKIAFVGVTTHYIPNWEQPSTIKNLTFEDAFSATKKTVEAIKDDVDIVIVNYHGGFERNLDSWELDVEDTGENQGSKMLREIDGIDLLLTGHQHRQENGFAYNTHYVQPGFNGSTVSLIDLDFDVLNRKVKIEKKIMSVSTYPEDINLQKLVDDIQLHTETFLDTPVGTTSLDLLIHNQLDARINKHPLVTLINDVQMKYSGAMISSCGLGNNISGFNKEISIRDVISTYIYPNTLVVKEVSGETLLRGLEKTAEFFEVNDNVIGISNKFKYPKVQLYSYDMYDGIDYTIDLSKAVGSRIVEATFQGQPLEQKKLYTLAMNNYRASGGGDYSFYKEAKTVNDTQTEILEILINYIVSQKELLIAHKNNIKIIY